MKKEKMGQPIKSLDNSGLFFIGVTRRFLMEYTAFQGCNDYLGIKRIFAIQKNQAPCIYD